MPVFVITNTHQQYKDFLRLNKLSPTQFIYPSNRNVLMGHRGFLYIECFERPDDYHEVYTRFILPYEAVRIKLAPLKQKESDNAE